MKYFKQAPYLTNHRQSLESSHYPTSTTDLSNTNTEIESNASSPGMPRVCTFLYESSILLIYWYHWNRDRLKRKLPLKYWNKSWQNQFNPVAKLKSKKGRSSVKSSGIHRSNSWLQIQNRKWVGIVFVKKSNDLNFIFFFRAMFSTKR